MMVTQTLITAPDGTPLALEDLPDRNTRRWVIRRKAEVVSAVGTGLLSFDDACVRYGLSTEELTGWKHLIDRHGVPGLRVTRVQHYR